MRYLKEFFRHSSDSNSIKDILEDAELDCVVKLGGLDTVQVNIDINSSLNKEFFKQFDNHRMFVNNEIKMDPTIVRIQKLTGLKIRSFFLRKDSLFLHFF